jgi:hypothetical protein
LGIGGNFAEEVSRVSKEKKFETWSWQWVVGSGEVNEEGAVVLFTSFPGSILLYKSNNY